MVSFSGDSLLGIVVSIIVLVIVIGNAIYLDGVRKELDQPNSPVKLSKTGADVFYFIDIILAIAISIYLIYNLWRLFTTTDQRSKVTQYVTAPRGATSTTTTRSQVPVITTRTVGVPTQEQRVL